MKHHMALLSTCVLAIGSLLTGNSPTLAASLPTAEPMVVVSSEGGFVAPGTNQVALPILATYQSGAVLTGDATNVRPDWLQMRSHSADIGKIRSLVIAVAKAAISPKSGWGIPGVADVPNTRIRIYVPGYARNLSVYALSFSNGASLTPPQISARKKLSSALTKLVDYAQKLPAKNYAPKNYEIWDRGLIMAGLGQGAEPTPTQSVGTGSGLANPASVFCTSSGSTLAIKDSPDGQVGYCTLADGKTIEEWAYFRAEGPKYQQWPALLKTPSKICTALKANYFATQKNRHTVIPQWLLPTGEVRTLTIRPVLPNETPCKRR